MPITIRWDGQKAGIIVRGQLTEATESFEKVWEDWDENGIEMIGSPLVAADENIPENVSGDGRVVEWGLTEFLIELQGLGYEVVGINEEDLERAA